MPCALADALPLALSPPLGFLPSARCHAGVFATSGSHTLKLGNRGLRVADLYIKSGNSISIADSHRIRPLPI